MSTMLSTVVPLTSLLVHSHDDGSFVTERSFYFSVYNRRSTRISVHFYSSFDTSTDIVWFIRRAGAGMRAQVHRSVHTTPDLWRLCF